MEYAFLILIYTILMKINALPVLASVFFMLSCTHKHEEKSVEEKFTVTSPLQLDTSFTKEYVSQIRSLKNIEIRAQEKGYLQNIYVDEGQHVHAGQILFRIMPRIYEAEYNKAKAEADIANIELQNVETLASKNIVAPNEVKLAKAKYEQAKAEMEIAKAHLSFTEIRAPYDGVIDRIPLRLGSLVDEGELLTSLSDNSQMQVYFNVSEPEYLEYQTNKAGRADNSISLKLANNTILPYKGNVELIESEFENETGNIAFRARFPNPDNLLKNGQTGKVQMKIPLKNALVIPQKATYELQDRKYVFVLDKSGVLKSRNISITGAIPDLYIVGSGLQSTDVILLEGIQKVKDDDKIKGDFIAPKEVLAQLKLKTE